MKNGKRKKEIRKKTGLGNSCERHPVVHTLSNNIFKLFFFLINIFVQQIHKEYKIFLRSLYTIGILLYFENFYLKE